MTVWEMIGTKLLAASAVTAIVGANVFHGDKPAGLGLPTVNYFEVSNGLVGQGVVEIAHYQISCRAETPGGAQDLAHAVAVVFHNMKETVSTFDVNAGSVLDKFLMKEPDTDTYHVPVDIRLAFDASENT